MNGTKLIHRTNGEKCCSSILITWPDTKSKKSRSTRMFITSGIRWLWLINKRTLYQQKQKTLLLNKLTTIQYVLTILSNFYCSLEISMFTSFMIILLTGTRFCRKWARAVMGKFSKYMTIRKSNSWHWKSSVTEPSSTNRLSYKFSF